jgi:hypothetical protein
MASKGGYIWIGARTERLTDSEIVWSTISESKKRGYRAATFCGRYNSSLARELANEGYCVITSKGSSWWSVKWE